MDRKPDLDIIDVVLTMTEDSKEYNLNLQSKNVISEQDLIDALKAFLDAYDENPNDFLDNHGVLDH